MDDTRIVRRLRLFLLGLSAWMCAATIVELLLIEHAESPAQILPFLLCGLGLVVVLAALMWPQRATLLALRGVMGLLLIGSLFGVYEHIEHNLAFELEIRPGAVAADVWFDALRGASPPLAPGTLALAAIVALAATYYHPALARARGVERPSGAQAG
jgi:hypothetical protein